MAAVPPRVASDKLDLLIVVDNSISMAHKQTLLQASLPALVERLIQPRCLDATGEPTGARADADGNCPSGTAENRPVTDLHLGVITTSLGAHGGDVCIEPEDDDKARLLPTMRPHLTPSVPTWNNAGFLAWDPDAGAPHHDPPGERDPAALVSGLQDMLSSAGELGCGYESSLEAWYRFLIDPEPPSEVRRKMDSAGNAIGTEAVFDPPDATLLAQRAAFLRPDSAVAILMLSDENDCSIRDDGQGFLVGLVSLSAAPFNLPRATSACATNPNSECCLSCSANSPLVPAACGNVASDPECAKGAYTRTEDSPNLRCFDQKRRFGFDLLYPIERYLDGLTARTVPSRRLDPDGEPLRVPNPLYAGTPARSPAQVFLAGIVGVPWQDLASEESLAGDSLEYLTHEELTEQDRWSLILGSPGDETTPPTLPRDALMFETTLDRSALGLPPHPLLNTPLAPPTAPASANPINGHEAQNSDGSDLQYACIFRLQTPTLCAADALGCDCKESDAIYQRPLCLGTTQTHAKAYPSIRQLKLLKAVGERTRNTVIASICPKTTDPGSETYGYRPAMDALFERLKAGLVGGNRTQLEP